MNKLLNSLSQFNRREQTTLLVGGLLILSYLIWLLVLAPIQRKETLLTASNTASEQSLGRVQLLARQIEVLSAQGNQAGAGNENINSVINASLQGVGLKMSTFVPGAGGEVRVGINEAGSEALMQWLYDLEVKHQIAIRDLTITTANKPGQVAVGVRLVKP